MEFQIVNSNKDYVCSRCKKSIKKNTTYGYHKRAKVHLLCINKSHKTATIHLMKLYKKDWVAVEMARRKKVFHKGVQWDKINLWGLFDYQSIKSHLKSGKLINHLNYKKENKIFWVIPSKEYYLQSIKPIVDNFTTNQLQESFYWSKDTYGEECQNFLNVI